MNEIRGEIQHHFEFVFIGPILRRPLLKGLDFKKLSVCGGGEREREVVSSRNF